MAVHVQSAFTGGEMAEEVWGRVDLAKYQVGLARARNVFIQVHGGAINRPGTEFIAHCSDYNRRHRAIEFEFNVDQTFVLVFGHLTLRFVQLGAPVVETSKLIEGITQANPGRMTITAHGFAAGDELFVASGGGMDELVGRYVRVANEDANSFDLVNQYGDNIDTTNYTAWTSGGEVNRVYQLTTPWPEDVLQFLTYEREGDVITITHPDYQTQDLRRVTNNQWTLTPFTAGSTVPAPTGVGAAPSGTSWEVVVTATDEEGVEESLPSDPPVTFSKPGTAVTFSWTPPGGVTPAFYNVYIRSVGAGQFGFIGSTPTTSFRYTSTMLEPDFTDVPPVDTPRFTTPDNYPGTVAFANQRQVFAGSNNEPTTFIGSAIAAYTNFNRNAASLRDSDSYSFTLVGRGNNAIKHLVMLDFLIILTEGAEWVAYGQSRDGDIRPTASPGLRERSYNGSSFVRPVVINDNLLYVQHHQSVVRDFRYTLESDNFSGSDLMVLAPHLVDGFQITDMAWQQVPHRLVWCVRDDGSMLTLSYMRDQDVWAWSTQDTWEGEFESVCSVSEDPEDAVYVTVKRNINGRTARFVERLHTRDMRCPHTPTCPSPAGESKKAPDQRFAFFVDSGLTYDVPFTITGVTNTSPAVLSVPGHNFVEGDWVDIEGVAGTMNPRIDDTLAGALNGKRFEVRNPSAGTVELYDYQEPFDPIDLSGVLPYLSGGRVRKAINSIRGLWHLEGEQLAVLGDANVLTNGFDDEIPIVVTDGAVTLPTRHGIVHLGLPMESMLRTLPLPVRQGSRKQIASLTMRVKDSRGLLVGPNLEDLNEWRQRFDELWGEPVALYTGDVPISVDARWEEVAQMVVLQRNPLPMSILSIIPDVESGY